MIVGTAGHIDHGKTSLVRRLTGVETDRLKEEKARGISIDIGFAYWPRPGGEIIGFVDVPGHEALVHNMLAGATGIDFVMLVVAADDGVMPQTREHIAIMDLLGLERGIVALNKCDLVSPVRLSEVTRDVSQVLAGTGLEGAPVVPVSAVSGEGIDAITAQLDAAVAAKHAARSKSGRFRLAVDRCFTLAGLGTTVTGTVFSGRVNVDDAWSSVRPASTRVSARSARTISRSITAKPGSVARWCSPARKSPRIPFGAATSCSIRRCTPRRPGSTQRCGSSTSEPKPISQWFPVKVHHAAMEVPGRVVVLRSEPIEPGEAEFIQLVLERPIAAAVGDRFVIRDTSSSRTIGGGTFVDLRGSERRRRTPERRRMLEAMALDAPEAALARALDDAGGWLDLDAIVRDRALASEAAPALIASSRPRRPFAQ